MRQIKISGKSAKLDLNAFFYPIHLVQQAGQAFEKNACVLVKREGTRVKVEITPKTGNAKETALHFANFMLGLKRELGENA